MEHGESGAECAVTAVPASRAARGGGLRERGRGRWEQHGDKKTSKFNISTHHPYLQLVMTRTAGVGQLCLQLWAAHAAWSDSAGSSI